MASRTNSPDLPTQEELRDQPIGELVKRLADETTTLVKQELRLAKAEMTEKGRQAGPGVGLVGAAGAVALLAAGTLTAFLILALDGVMPNWLAALIVGLVYAAIAAALWFTGKDRVQAAGRPVPEQTVETLKEDVAWAKTQLGSDKR